MPTCTRGRAQARLVAANLTFNNEHLDLIRQVSQAYFSLLGARGLREAAEVSLKDARTTETAAQERRNNGLATVPEVLEAKAATAKAAYDLQSAIGAERVEIGNLARAITANPVKPLQVEPLDQLKIPDKLDQSVEDAGFAPSVDPEQGAGVANGAGVSRLHCKKAAYRASFRKCTTISGVAPALFIFLSGEKGSSLDLRMRQLRVRW